MPDPHDCLELSSEIGNSGTSIATANDLKKFYFGFGLCSPSAWVPMTGTTAKENVLKIFDTTDIIGE